MVNYNLYKTFYVVAREGNITKASEKLYISQPAVSESIKDLEGQLNQKLFVRKNKGVELTGFGKVLFERVKILIADLDDIENMGQVYDKLGMGRLSIGVSSANLTQLLLKTLSYFMKKYPNVNIKTSYGNRENLIEQIDRGNCDMIFVDYFEGCEKKYEIVNEFDVAYRLIGSAKYKREFSENTISAEDFPIKELILPSGNNGSRNVIESYFAKHNKALDGKYEFDNYKLIYEFVKMGFGVAFVNTEFYKDKIDAHEVEIIYPDFYLPARRLVCLVKKGEKEKIVKEFMKLLK